MSKFLLLRKDCLFVWMTIRILMTYPKLTQTRFLLHLSFFFFFPFSFFLPFPFFSFLSLSFSLNVPKFETSVKEDVWMPNIYSGCVPCNFYVFLSVSSFFLTQLLTSRKNKGVGGINIYCVSCSGIFIIALGVSWVEIKNIFSCQTLNCQRVLICRERNVSFVTSFLNTNLPRNKCCWQHIFLVMPQFQFSL